MLKECVVCGRFFEARGNSKTCSSECGKERKRERERERLAIPENREKHRERSVSGIQYRRIVRGNVRVNVRGCVSGINTRES